MPTKEDINYSLLPDYMQEGMRLYMERGIPTGDFLFYILSNNFVAAGAQADSYNQHRLFDYCNFLYNEAPTISWGKEETVWTWMKHHGFVGLEVKEGVFYSVGYWMDDEVHGMGTANYTQLKPCFLYSPTEPTKSPDGVPIHCIFHHDSDRVTPIYHWIHESKAWFPGKPSKEEQQQ